MLSFNYSLRHSELSCVMCCLEHSNTAPAKLLSAEHTLPHISHNAVKMSLLTSCNDCIGADSVDVNLLSNQTHCGSGADISSNLHSCDHFLSTLRTDRIAAKQHDAKKSMSALQDCFAICSVW